MYDTYTLASDNADTRLTRRGIEAGIVSKEREECLKDRESKIEYSLNLLSTVTLQRAEWAAFGQAFQMSQRDGKPKTAADVLSMPNITLEEIVSIVKNVGIARQDDALSSFEVTPLVFDTVEATVKYSTYLTRQDTEMARWRKSGHLAIPTDIEYTHERFPAFSSEELEKLNRYQPRTLHEASQLQGLTPHALVYLHNYISRGKYARAKSAAQNLVAAGAGAGAGAGMALEIEGSDAPLENLNIAGMPSRALLSTFLYSSAVSLISNYTMQRTRTVSAAVTAFLRVCIFDELCMYACVF